MQGRNLKEVIVGHLQRVLISYLETLSVTQLDRQESSLTWTAYVSLNRHAFMHSAALIYCGYVIAVHAALPSFLFIWILLDCDEHSFPGPISPSPAPSLSSVTLPASHFPFMYMMLQTAHELEFDSSVMHLLHFDQTWLLSAAWDAAWNCLLICPRSGKVRCEPPLCSGKHRELLCVYAGACVECVKERRECSSQSALAWFASLHTNADQGSIIARVHSESSFSHRFQQPHAIWRREGGGLGVSADLLGWLGLPVHSVLQTQRTAISNFLFVTSIPVHAVIETPTPSHSGQLN